MTGTSRIMGFIIIAVTILIALGNAGNLAWYIDTGSVLFIGGVLIGGLWLCFGPRLVLEAMMAALKGQCVSEKGQLSLFVAVYDRAYQLAWGGGIVGMLIGLVQILQNMDNPSMIGPGMAFGLMSVLYGASLAEFVVNPLQQILINKASPPPATADAAQTPRRSMLGLGAATVGLALAMFVLVMVAMMPLGM